MPKRRRTYAPPIRGSAARNQILTRFDRHFSSAKKVVGHGKTTTNVELEEAMRKMGLGPGKVTHVCEVEKMKSQGTLPPFVIANIMCKPPGQHWVAYYKGYKYDPLGKDSSKSAEQNNVETNCGQRCLGYLAMCKSLNKTIFL